MQTRTCGGRFGARALLGLAGAAAAGVLAAGPGLAAGNGLPAPVTVNTGWALQDAVKVTAGGGAISRLGYRPAGWYRATVPGTVLTSLVNDRVYPEPLYGENNRPDKIPESLCRTAYWYRTTFRVPQSYAGRRIHLDFAGINYTAEVWVNGHDAGAIRGAFTRGLFDVTPYVTPGAPAALAVQILPLLHPGVTHEKTQAAGTGGNGGATAEDGPTFLATIGWDWMPGIRDRDMGIWQAVTLSATGPVTVRDPYVTSVLPLPRTDSADLTVQATLRNGTAQAQSGTLMGQFGQTKFARAVTLAPGEARTVVLDPATTPVLHLNHPRLWWPNGYGPQNLYTLHLKFVMAGATAAGRGPAAGGGPANEFAADGVARRVSACADKDLPVRSLSAQADTRRLATQRRFQSLSSLSDTSLSSLSDVRDVTFGVRQVAYAVPGSDNLTLSVNGVPVVAKGGDWGMDEAMKRLSRPRLDAEVRMHALAHYTIIRNWVGQSTGDDFYDLCDKYGILLWDEFFQPNPSDGPNPDDTALYLANIREKILRYRSHPSIALWCGRNEGFPPPAINDGIKVLMAELEKQRLYQPSSTDGRGVHSGGPYQWRTPREYYTVDAPFKTEIGSVSVPTLESIHAMMPAKDWGAINDDWAEHDMTRGAQAGDRYPITLGSRYGREVSLADFVRKAQMANYEAYRAMYEGRLRKLFAPTTGVITWMSNPAQPSFVWQLYGYDLDPNASLFGTQKACEPVHVQLDQDDWHVSVINDRPYPLAGVTARVRVYDLDGTLKSAHTDTLTAAPSAATDIGLAAFPAGLSPVHFVQLELRDARKKLLSDNFYWRADPAHPDDFTALNQLPTVNLAVTAVRHDAGGRCLIDVTLKNPTHAVALMTHLQLRRARSQTRVLPAFYTDNYVSLLPGQSKTLTVDAATKDLRGEAPTLAVDGWNVTARPAAATATVAVVPNTGAFVPPTPARAVPIRGLSINCGGPPTEPFPFEPAPYAGFLGDSGRGGTPQAVTDAIDTSTPNAAPALVYQSARVGASTYNIAVPDAGPHTVRLHFAETAFTQAGARRFNVTINGQPALTDFDVFAAAGAKAKAVVKDFPGVLPDATGRLVIALTPGSAGQPEISGIQVLP